MTLVLTLKLLYMLIIFIETILLYNFKGFILANKTQQNNTKEF